MLCIKILTSLVHFVDLGLLTLEKIPNVKVKQQFPITEIFLIFACYYTFIALKKLSFLISNKIFCYFRSIDQNEKVCQNGCLPTLKPCPVGEICDITPPWDAGVYG